MAYIPTREERLADEKAKSQKPKSEVEKLFDYPDDSIVIKCELKLESQFDHKIQSICDYWHDKRRISEKQKWCLCFFLVEGSSSKPADKRPAYSPKDYPDDDIPF